MLLLQGTITETYIKAGNPLTRTIKIDGEYGCNGSKGSPAQWAFPPYASDEVPDQLTVDIWVRNGSANFHIDYPNVPVDATYDGTEGFPQFDESCKS